MKLFVCIRLNLGQRFNKRNTATETVSVPSGFVNIFLAGYSRRLLTKHSIEKGRPKFDSGVAG
jgi:hypothetical protein